MPPATFAYSHICGLEQKSMSSHFNNGCLLLGREIPTARINWTSILEVSLEEVPVTEKALRGETLVAQCDAVCGPAVFGDKLCSPGLWIKVTKFLNESCGYLVKRKVVAGHACVGKDVAGQMAIQPQKAIVSLKESPYTPLR